MRIHEIGIIYDGIPVICVNFHKFGSLSSKFIHGSGFISGILIFAEKLIEPLEYIESDKFCVVFKKDRIYNEFKAKENQIIVYVVIDKEKEFDKYLKKILPSLEKIINKFISKHKTSFLNEISQYKEFKRDLKRAFEIDSKKLEDRVISLFP